MTRDPPAARPGSRKAPQPSAEPTARRAAVAHPATMRWTPILVGLALTAVIAGLAVAVLLD